MARTESCPVHQVLPLRFTSGSFLPIQTPFERSWDVLSLPTCSPAPNAFANSSPLSLKKHSMGVARRLRSTWLASTSTENPIHTTRGPTRTKGSRRRRACLPTGAVSRFSWDGPDEEHFSIYVKSLDWPSPVRLTRSSADDNYPVWSPDGRQIAFYRDSGENSAVYIVPAGGGRETRLTSANG